MIGIIAAVSSNGVIGVDGKLPFNYPEDMKHFRNTTSGSTIIMGRKTFESIGKPLPKRKNIILSKSNFKIDGADVVNDFKEAIDLASKDINPIWLIGGSHIYEAGMDYAETIVLTITPDVIDNKNSIKFPWINPSKFELKTIKPLLSDNSGCKLLLATYTKLFSC